MTNKLLVFGGSGLVGSNFINESSTNFEIRAPSTDEVNILNLDGLCGAIESFSPDVVLNFAAYTNVEEAENQEDDKSGVCYKVNAEGAKNVANVCKKFDVYLIHISTEYIFEGAKDEGPYKEEDKPNPINWYGMTKYFGEEFVLQSGAKNTIVRLSMPYAAYFEGKKDIARFFLGELQNNRKITAISDQQITPTFVLNIIYALWVIIKNKRRGLYHVSCKDHTTPYDFAQSLAKQFGLDQNLVEKVSFEQYNQGKRAKLLKFSWLDSSKFVGEFGQDILHTIEQELKMFKQEIDSKGTN